MATKADARFTGHGRLIARAGGIAGNDGAALAAGLTGRADLGSTDLEIRAAVLAVVAIAVTCAAIAIFAAIGQGFCTTKEEKERKKQKNEIKAHSEAPFSEGPINNIADCSIKAVGRQWSWLSEFSTGEPRVFRPSLHGGGIFSDGKMPSAPVQKQCRLRAPPLASLCSAFLPQRGRVLCGFRAPLWH